METRRGEKRLGVDKYEWCVCVYGGLERGGGGKY